MFKSDKVTILTTKLGFWEHTSHRKSVTHGFLGPLETDKGIQGTERGRWVQETFLKHPGFQGKDLDALKIPPGIYQHLKCRV